MIRGIAFFLLAVLPLTAAEPLRVLIVTGNTDEPFHHWRQTTPVIREFLQKAGRFDVRLIEEPRGINAVALQGYDVVLLNYNGPRFPPEAEAAIEAFVRSGHGLAAFHQACYGPFFGMEFREKKWRAGSGPGWAEYAKMIGANWPVEKIGHAKRGVFSVDWLDKQQPSFEANDELYHRLTILPDVHVLADGLSPKEAGGTGEREPLIWTHSYGQGRVFFTTLGHDAKAWQQPGLAAALTRGLEWAASGK